MNERPPFLSKRGKVTQIDKIGMGGGMPRIIRKPYNIIEGWWQPGRVGGMGATSLICTHNRYTSVAFSGRRHMEGP